MTVHVCDACLSGDCLACTAVNEGAEIAAGREPRRRQACLHDCHPQQVGKIDRRYRRIEPGQPYRIGGWHAGKPAA